MHNESTFHAFDEDEFKDHFYRPRPTKLISRGHAYLQYNVSAKERGSWFMNFYQRFTESWWHTVIHLNIIPLFALIFFSYMLVFVAFVPVYMAISDNCGLKIGEDSGEPFLDALYLSVETMTTIGYGVPDQYYNGCPEGLICVVGQSLIGFMMNAVLFGTVFTRIARSHGRGNAIKFSLKAIVRKIRGRYFIMFQVVDARTTQALQVSMKLWCVRHDWIGENPCQLVSMRCLQPNDSVSTYLLLATPNLIVHEIDVWSPLHPPRDSNEPIASDASYEYQWPSPPMRSDDSRRAERSEYACRVCGEMFTVATYLKQHISYYVNGQEEDMSTKCEHCDMTFSCREELVAHRMCSHNNKQLTLAELKEQRPELYHNHTFFYNGDGNPHADMKTWPENAPAKVSKDQIRTWLLLSQPEMIAIVAGVDPVTGANFEAVQSYTHEDIIWDHRFVNCVERPTPLSKDEHEGRVTVDYSLFDKIVPCEDVPVGADVGKGEIVSHV